MLCLSCEAWDRIELTGTYLPFDVSCGRGSAPKNAVQAVWRIGLPNNTGVVRGRGMEVGGGRRHCAAKQNGWLASPSFRGAVEVKASTSTDVGTHHSRMLFSRLSRDPGAIQQYRDHSQFTGIGDRARRRAEPVSTSLRLTAVAIDHEQAARGQDAAPTTAAKRRTMPSLEVAPLSIYHPHVLSAFSCRLSVVVRFGQANGNHSVLFNT